jgi:N-methylhydantoinase A
VCRDILDIAARKVISVVRDFVAEYKLDPHAIALVGGGGGAEAIVPHVGALMKQDHWIADHAEVISAIGVALGMIQDTVERSILDPTEADLLRVRNEAFQSVVRMGAAAETVDVRVEVDPRRKRVMATARGTPDLRTRTFGGQPLPLSELSEIAARTCGVPVAHIRCAGETEFLKVFQTRKVNRKLLGLFRSSTNPTRIVDTEGIVRLKLPDAWVYGGRIGELLSRLAQLVDEFTMFGDAGGLQPDVFVALSGRIIDLSGLTTKDQVISLLRTEAEGFSADEAAVAILSRK